MLAKRLGRVVKQDIGLRGKHVALNAICNFVATREIKALQRFEFNVQHAIVSHTVATISAGR
jgi:hypothetical protein